MEAGFFRLIAKRPARSPAFGVSVNSTRRYSFDAGTVSAFSASTRPPESRSETHTSAPCPARMRNVPS
jgi:hypothetical protein